MFLDCREAVWAVFDLEWMYECVKKFKVVNIKTLVLRSILIYLYTYSLLSVHWHLYKVSPLFKYSTGRSISFCSKILLYLGVSVFCCWFTTYKRTNHRILLSVTNWYLKRLNHEWFGLLSGLDGYYPSYDYSPLLGETWWRIGWHTKFWTFGQTSRGIEGSIMGTR